MSILTLAFYGCSRLGNRRSRCARKLIDCLRDLGASFLTLKNGLPHPCPYDDIDADGDIITIPGISHASLRRDQFSRTKSGPGSAEFGFIFESRCVTLGQSIPDGKSKNGDEVARSLVEIGQELWEALSPNYGYAAEPGDNEPYLRTCRNMPLTHVFWANFFGPELVQRLGKSFLLRAPAWRSECIAGGGVICIATKSYAAWCRKPPKRLVEYFKQRHPNIQGYQSIGLDGTEEALAVDAPRERERRRRKET
jgi:hypothetical protein